MDDVNEHRKGMLISQVSLCIDLKKNVVYEMMLSILDY